MLMCVVNVYGISTKKLSLQQVGLAERSKILCCLHESVLVLHPHPITGYLSE